MNELLLEKRGETKTDNLIQDCYKIYRESFDKLFPEYFENQALKAISFVTTHDKDSNEIKNIGMSCPDDLLCKQFAQWLSGLIGGSNGANPDAILPTTGISQLALGSSHGGSNFGHWGTRLVPPTGMHIRIGNGTDIPFKDAFNSTGMFQLLAQTNTGSFNSGLGSVTWSATDTADSDNTIRQTTVLGFWKLGGAGSILDYLLSWDIINPVVPIFLAETINVEYKLVFS